MSVVGTAQKRPNTGSATFEAGKYTLRDVYLVITDTVTDDALTVTAASGLPRLFDAHPSQTLMRARSFEAERVGPASLGWDVTVVYETPPMKDGGGGSSAGGTGPGSSSGPGGATGTETEGAFENPILELPSVKFTVTRREVAITQVVDAVTGALKPPTSSNGEPYDPPPKRQKTYVKLEISRNESITAPHPAIGITYADAVNNDVFWGMDPGVWQCQEIVAERQVRQLPSGVSQVFLRVTYQFEGTDSWDIVLLDYGTFYLKCPSDNLAIHPATIHGFVTAERTPTVAPLNGSGGPLVVNLPFTVDAGTDILTVVVGTSGVTFAVGDIVQLKNLKVGGAGALPVPLVAGQAYYVVFTTGATIKLGLTSGGAAIDITTAGTGLHYIDQPPVYNTIRPYPRLPFAELALPQSFLDCQ